MYRWILKYWEMQELNFVIYASLFFIKFTVITHKKHKICVTIPNCFTEDVTSSTDGNNLSFLIWSHQVKSWGFFVCFFLLFLMSGVNVCLPPSTNTTPPHLPPAGRSPFTLWMIMDLLFEQSFSKCVWLCFLFGFMSVWGAHLTH